MKGMYYICYLVVMLVLVVAADIINFTSNTLCGKKVIKCFDL